MNRPDAGSEARTWPWIDRLIDRANPMLVRCIRQELRSRGFLVNYCLGLAVATVASLIAAKVSYDAIAAGREAAYGEGVFAALLVVWSFIVIIIQTMGAFRIIAHERQQDTWDLVELTGMPPGLVVRGLLQAVCVQSLLYTTALAPYMMLAYLLRGIDLLTIIGTVVFMGGIGLATAATGAVIGTLSRPKTGRSAVALLLGIGVFFLWWLLIVFSFEEHFGLREWFRALIDGDLEEWLASACIVTAWLAWIVLALVVGAARLTHPAGDRSSIPRLVAAIIVVVLLAWFAVLLWLIPTSSGRGYVGDLSAAWAVILAWSAAILGFFTTTEDVTLTPRQWRAIDHSVPGRPIRSALRRLLMTVSGPGAVRGHRYFLVLVIAAAGCGLLAWHLDPATSRWDPPAVHALLVAGYAAACYGCYDVAVRRILAGRLETVAQRRLFLWIFLVVISLLPLLLAWLTTGHGNPMRSPWLILSPMFGITAEDRLHPTSRMLAVWGFGVIGVIACLRMACRRSVSIRRVLATGEAGGGDGT